MKSKHKVILAAGLLSCSLGLRASFAAPPSNSDEPPLKLKVGDEAPDFTLQYSDGSDLKKVSLHDYRGKKNVVVAFYVFAFTGG